MNIKNPIIFLSITILTAGLIACGGDGSSSSGASSDSPFSSSLVVEIDSNAGLAGLYMNQNQPKDLASRVSSLFIESAIAQTAGVPVFINGEQFASTDAAGSAVIPLQAGVYELCVLNTNPENCITVTVDPDSVVVVDGVSIDEAGNVSYAGIDTERAQDNIVAFQDPVNANKTLVCHKNKQTISVGTPAAQNGHFGHGDSLGACPDSINQASVNDDDTSEDQNAEDEEDKASGNSNKKNSG